MAGERSYQLIITQEADIDKNLIVDWYETQAAGLGKRWLDHYEQIEHSLAHHPLLYQEDLLFVRKVAVRPFKHNVFYVVDDDELTVVILGILHQHQHTNEILRRLNFI